MESLPFLNRVTQALETVLTANALDPHAELLHRAGVDHATAIKDPLGLGHGAGDADPVDALLGLVLLSAAHAGSEAGLLGLALLLTIGAGSVAVGLLVEAAEGVARLLLGALDQVLVQGKQVVLRGGGRLEGAGIRLGVGLAADHLGGLAGSGGGRRLGGGGVAELIELGSNDNGSAAVAGVVGVAVDSDLGGGLGAQKGPDLFLDNQRVAAGVEDGDLAGALLEEGLDHLQGGGLTGVGGVLLEGVAEDGDLLADEGVVQALDDTVGEAVTGVLVHLDDLAPVLANLGQAHGVGQVDEVEDILLETAATETDTSDEELVADTGVDTDGTGNLVDISAGLLTDSGDGVDGGDTLGQHGVGDQLGQLGRPDIGGQDALTRNPSGVDVNEGLGGLLARGGRGRTNEDTVGIEQVIDGGTGGQELGVGQDLELNTGAVDGKLRHRRG